MADDENLSIRISELPETSTISGSDDYLAVIKPSALYTSGYKSFKVKASKLPGGGGGGSGGHTIVDEEGTSLEQRDKLQFNGAYLADNSTDDTTEVNVVVPEPEVT